MFVQAQLPEGRRDGLRVPQVGVTRDAKGQATALVVNARNIVEPRAVQTERVVGADWLVTGGLAAGDRVVVSGLQKIKPGDEVKPTEAAPATAEAVTASMPHA
jgi:multidrug efflux pump subunit AcrA (membrane-fusion protein)